MRWIVTTTFFAILNFGIGELLLFGRIGVLLSLAHIYVFGMIWMSWFIHHPRYGFVTGWYRFLPFTAQQRYLVARNLLLKWPLFVGKTLTVIRMAETLERNRDLHRKYQGLMSAGLYEDAAEVRKILVKRQKK